MPATIIDGVAMARDIRAEVAEGVREMNAKHSVVPGLAVVLVGGDPASAVYVRNKERAASEAGMTVQVHRPPADATQQEVRALVETLNDDTGIHGIIVQLPLPAHLDAEAILESIRPGKDVDGLHPVNLGRLVAGRPGFVPATPLGIQQMLLRSGHDPEGKHAVICGRSDIVGKPIANLLMRRRPGANATVTVCHTRTKDLVEITRQADILIAAIGRPLFITADMVKEGAVVIDVGINRVDAPEHKRGYRLVGDVDYGAVSAKAVAITPVPGGVGPMTIAMLLRNTLTATRNFIHPAPDA